MITLTTIKSSMKQRTFSKEIHKNVTNRKKERTKLTASLLLLILLLL